MTDREDFLLWVNTALHDAEVALHSGDPGPRLELWARNEPVSVLGAWRSAHGRTEVEQLFVGLAETFSDFTSFTFELLAYDVVGNVAYTAGLERSSTAVDGQARTYTLRVTQVYRRERGAWKVVHRHADTVEVAVHD